MKQLSIQIDINDESINSEIRTRGFEDMNELEKALEIINKLQKFKKQTT